MAVRGSRPLTPGEIALAHPVFGGAIQYDAARVAGRKWVFFQPRNTVMAPTGCIHFHPDGGLYRDDFSNASLSLQGLFIHEMTHIWQAQAKGRFYLPLMRHPFCRYAYRFEAGKPFAAYGIEQQAELVRHLFLSRKGAPPAGVPPLPELEETVRFSPNGR
ncbi:vgr related protein [Stakelama sp. CBK3Z-3]|uniref:Vgr related protein n=1 Tax=Stakelama flava TaxID=2860338 RepID=A0ABS6XR29_9SPHN|nr:vgr related protein [Stakelama flava]MBW4331860.1 vgr related protein [Stakelama flava]